jgi:restriction endonuclease S subunit
MRFIKSTLGEILTEIKTGKTPPTSVPEYFGHEINWYTPGDLDREKYLNESKRGITRKALDDKKAVIYGSNTILVGCIGEIGKIGITKGISSSNQQITGLLPDQSKVNSEYLFYWLKKNKRLLERSSTNAIVPILNNKQLASIKISYPSNLEDQIYIANVLSKAEALINQRKESLRLLDEFLKSTFLEMFGDPVRNEKGWPLKRLPEIGESRLGKMLDGKKIVGNNLKPYLRNTNVLWFRFKLDELLEMDFDEKDKLEFSLKYGDILMCEGGEIGRCAIWKDELTDCYFQKAIHRIRLKKESALPEYFVFMFWLYAKNGGLDRFMGAATISHLTGEKLKGMHLPIPPVKLQKEFAHIVEKTDLLKAQYSASLKELENLYTSLSQRAFKGELRFKSDTKVIPLQFDEKEEDYFKKRKALACYIINQSLEDDKFGDTKFEKLLFLSDYEAIKRNFGQNYYQKVAGPYDNTFTNTFYIQVQKSKLFKRKRGEGQTVFLGGANHEKSLAAKDYFSEQELQKVDRLINIFKKSDYEKPEIIATLYAVWNNRIIRQQQITDEFLKEDFLTWDPKKAKYKGRLEAALAWMRKENIVPDGWGKLIEKPKSKTRRTSNHE